jgi:hypothetical protein
MQWNYEAIVEAQEEVIEKLRRELEQEKMKIQKILCHSENQPSMN